MRIRSRQTGNDLRNSPEVTADTGVTNQSGPNNFEETKDRLGPAPKIFEKSRTFSARDYFLETLGSRDSRTIWPADHSVRVDAGFFEFFDPDVVRSEFFNMNRLALVRESLLRSEC